MTRFLLIFTLPFAIIVLLIAGLVTTAHRQGEPSPYWAMMYNTRESPRIDFGTDIYLFHPSTGIARPLMSFDAQYDATVVLSGYLFTVTPDRQWFWFPENIDQMTRHFDQIARYHWTGTRAASLNVPSFDMGLVFRSLRWSPNGKFAIFAYPDEDNHLTVYRIDAVTGVLTTLSSEFDYYSIPTIIWIDNEHAILRDPNEVPIFALYDVDLKDWTLRRILTVERLLETPIVAPSGRHFAYSAYPPDQELPSLVVMNLDGDVLRELKFDGQVDALVWDGDDTLLGWLALNDVQAELSSFGLRLTLSNGLRQFSSLPDVSYADEILWSPNREYYAILPDSERRDLLPTFTIEIRSQRHQLLAVATPQQSCQPAQTPYWSPDSQWLMYWERNDSLCFIKRLHAADGIIESFSAIPNDAQIAFFRTPPNPDWIELVVYAANDRRAPARLVEVASGRDIQMPVQGIIESWISIDFQNGHLTWSIIVGSVLFLLSVKLGTISRH